MAAVTSTSKSMQYQLLLTKCLQNTASLSNFNKFHQNLWDKANDFSWDDRLTRICRPLVRVYSVSNWVLVTGHMSYVSQSKCQKVLAVWWTLHSNVAPSISSLSGVAFYLKKKLIRIELLKVCSLQINVLVFLCTDDELIIKLNETQLG